MASRKKRIGPELVASKPQGTGFPVVGIGASAGGLEAFEAFFKAMPEDSGMAFVLVVHLDPTHVSLLPELLQKRTRMRVCQAADGVKVEPDTVYVIPPNKDLRIFNGTLHLLDQPRPRGAYLPIDSFFRSLAQDQGAGAVGIVLSGTGTDGTLGLKAVKGALGMVMVQDEASARYDGMPRSAAAANVADYVLAPEEMPAKLISYTRHAHLRTAAGIVPGPEGIPDALSKIFLILRDRTGHDFSLYKKTTLCRRIERRMNVHQIAEVADYVRYLRESDREVGILFKELLIGVTNFFRDPEAFEALREALLLVLRQKPDGEAVRCWIPGCSSGEEAYSVAILLDECMAKLERRFHVQVFGTDIDEDAVAAARAGLYPASIVDDVGPERLRRYFVREDDGRYRIRKTIREMLVFAPQDLVKDPPFTKLDLVSCRNLLIYLVGQLQKKLLPVFHYSLRHDGILLLGSSETIGQATDLFETVDRKWKLFRRLPVPTVPHAVLELPAAAGAGPVLDTGVSQTVRRAEETSAFQLVETILKQSGTPPCAIVDDASNLVWVHGRTGRFLEPAEGRVSVNVVEMARPGLKGELAAALRKVSLRKQEVVLHGLRVQLDGEEIAVELTVKPILEQGALRGLTMVSFQETAPPPPAHKKKAGRPAAKRKGRTVAELEEDLRHTRESLQITIEELETSNEELKSTNEELQSTNEELQSTNEEMETSKEELQSLNEESVTVNAELQARIEELSKANDDLKNLLDSTEIATVFLDGDLCVRRFTPRVTEIIPLSGADFGRPIRHFACDLADVDLAEGAEAVLKDLAMREEEVFTGDARCFRMRIRPYRTVANVIDGVVMTFDDITELKRVERSLRESEKALQGLLASQVAVQKADGE